MDYITDLENWSRLDFFGNIRLLLILSTISIGVLSLIFVIALMLSHPRVAGAGLVFAIFFCFVGFCLLLITTVWFHKGGNLFNIKNIVWGNLPLEYVPGCREQDIKEGLEWALKLIYGKKPVDKIIKDSFVQRRPKESFWVALRVVFPLLSDSSHLEKLKSHTFTSFTDMAMTIMEIYSKEKKFIGS